MKDYTYIYLFINFILNVLSLGSCLAKSGTESKTSYTGIHILFYVAFSILSGLALYFFPI